MNYKHDGKAMAHMAVNYQKLYHTDWNWIVPVVDKINRIGDKNGYGYGIGIRYAQIEATFNAVVKFIKWYNENLTPSLKQ